MLLPGYFTVSPFTYISFKKSVWISELYACPLHEVKMDSMLKNKRVVNFIVSLLKVSGRVAPIFNF
jgi:hypothetical protein